MNTFSVTTPPREIEPSTVSPVNVPTDVREELTTVEPRVVVEDVEVYPDQNENAFSCKIFFSIRGIREMQELGLVLERLR